MPTIQSIQPSITNFRTNNNPCETHAALKTRAVGTGTAAAFTILVTELGDCFIKTAKNLGELAEAPKNEMDSLAKDEQLIKATKKHNLFILPVGILASLGCGYLIDKMVNKKHQQLAEDMKTKTRQEILANNDNVETTEKGNLYYNTALGKKVGTAFGAVASPVLDAISAVAFKTKARPVLNIIVGAIGGLIIGAISDHFANKTAKQHADRQAEIKQL